MKHLTNGDQLKKSHEVRETHVSHRVYMFCPGPTSRDYPRCAGQLLLSSKRHYFKSNCHFFVRLFCKS